MDPDILLHILLTALLLVLLWRSLRQSSEQARLLETLARVDTQLDEQSRNGRELGSQLEARSRATEELIRGLERPQRAGQLAMLQALERRLRELRTEQTAALAESRTQTVHALWQLREALQKGLAQYQARFEQRQTQNLKLLQDSLHSGIQGVQTQLGESLSRSSHELGSRLEGLTVRTDERLGEISGQVERRLSEGFEKTTATFSDVLKRLALIDEAQKRITDLSSNVVSLQEVLADKRSRGAFGEVQLNGLVRNVMPESSFQLQYTLPNGTRADCILFLPEPTGQVVIDAKFPLESYRRMTDESLDQSQRQTAKRQFQQDIRKHISDIAKKYILPGVTSDGAVMFIPAEAIFAEVQAHHPALLEEAYAARVWLCSPTTLMAVLNTARAVLKDDATRRQVHIIQEHLSGLSKDFDRFRKRMDNLARHIRQANEDVNEVNTSAGKISDRFEKIERVEIESPEQPLESLPAGGEERAQGAGGRRKGAGGNG